MAVKKLNQHWEVKKLDLVPETDSSHDLGPGLRRHFPLAYHSPRDREAAAKGLFWSTVALAGVMWLMLAVGFF